MTSIDLKHPITNGQAVIRTLSFRDVNWGDVEAATLARTEFELGTIIASRLSGLPLDVIRQIHIEDLDDVAKACMEAVDATTAKIRRH